MNDKLKTLITRSTSGIIFGMAMILAMTLSPMFTFGIFGISMAVVVYEVSTVVAAGKRVKPYTISTIISAIIIYATFGSTIYNFMDVSAWITFAIAAGVLILGFVTAKQKNVADFVASVAITGYVALPFILALKLSMVGGDFSGKWLLPIVILIWSYDTFAYLSGITMGKHKLFPSISPKKTIEGAIGGMILTMAFSLIFWHLYPEKTILFWQVLAIIVIFAATFGDLFESWVKRKSGVKDSGTIMPGHGGLWDRFDSFLIVIPAVYILF